MQSLPMRDPQARERFRSAARGFSLDPDNLWLGGYVDYEWHHARHVLECSGIEIAGAKVIEFGCNIGATSIVLASLGADVTAVDVDPRYVELARLNAAAYGLAERIEYLYLTDTARLPFPDGSCDLITCNSVLEYVAHDSLSAIQRELDRVLKPGGVIIIEATSNRLYPWESHTGKWYNYLPRFFDRLMGRNILRGVSPWRMRWGFGSAYRDLAVTDRGSAYLESRKRMGMNGVRRLTLAAGARLLAPLRLSVGLFTPTLAVWLQKGRAPGAIRDHRRSRPDQ